LFDPEATEGSVRWDEVSSLTIDIPGAGQETRIGFRAFALVTDSLGSPHLGAALGMRTFLLSPTEPNPPSAAALLSATTAQPARILEWEQVSSSLYHLRVSADSPYNLIVSNTYHPLWRVIIDGREIEPQPSYYLVNAYAIDKVGEYDLTVEFMGQRYQRFAFGVSGLAYAVTCSSLVGCLLWPWVRKRRQRTD
jgi:hypothetical protein